MRVSAPIASALTDRLRATKLSSACSIWPSVALAVSYIALASPFTSSGPRCLRIVAASSSSSSISRMAAADDPAIAGRAGAGSRAEGRGDLLQQLGPAAPGALRLQAHEGDDPSGGAPLPCAG